MRFTSAVLALFSLSMGHAQAENWFCDCGDYGNSCPEKMIQALEAAGATNINISQEVGVLTFESENEIQVDGATIFPNYDMANVAEVITGASDDELVVEQPSSRRMKEKQRRLDGVYPPNTSDDDFFLDLQWYHEAVGSIAAWEQGTTGAGVTVAVLDTGIDADHPDLASNLNLGKSRSFVPGEGVEYALNGFLHGTHVAGIIGAANNGFGTVGVAPNIELVHVKVLSDYTGSGSFSGIIEGIIYAANLGVDIINMSLGAVISKSKGPEYNYSADLAHLKNAVCGAITYAKQKGVTVIVAAGNEGQNFHGAGGAHVIRFNNDCQNAIAITAAAPRGWAVDPTTDLYTQAYYSSFGHTDFAGPGGSIDYGLETDPYSICTVGFLTRPCYVFDLSLSTSKGGWSWAQGTSMAAPGAAGVAALIISENIKETGEGLKPAQVKSEMKKRALGINGNGYDQFYGNGHVHSGYYF